MFKKVVIFIPSIEKGGVERNAIWVANELVHRDIQVDVLYVRARAEQLLKFDEKVNLIVFPGTMHHLFNKRIEDAINIRQRFSEYLKKQDRKHTVVLSFQSSIIAIRICRKNHIKVICRLSSHPEVIKYEKDFVRKISQWLKPFFYKKADLVIGNSIRLSNDFALKIKKNVETVYNPISLERIELLIKEPIEPDLEKEAVEFKNKLIISVGRLAPEKDYITLIEGIALSKYRDQIKLWIVGEGPEYEKIYMTIKNRGLENTIRLLGYKENVYAYMKKASIYIQTSLYEGCPNALIEAVAVGLPAISTNCLSGPAEVLLNGEGGVLIDLQNPQQVGDAVDRYIENPSLFEEKQKKALLAVDRFDNARIMNRYVYLIEKVLDSGTRDKK